MSNKKKAINGAKWTSVSTVINAVLQFAQVAVIARILAPSSFGIVSISTLVINFLSIFAHFGFSNSIIYTQESDKKALSTIYYINIMMGLAIFVIIYLTAPLLVIYFHEPKLAGVLRAAAFYFPIVFLGQIFNILLEKELKFKWLALNDILTAVSGTAITVFLAYKGYQAMALIYGLLAGQLIKMVLLNIRGRQFFTPIFHFDINDIKEHLKFGLFNVADSILGFANGNIDTILIGGLLGVKELGYYTIASQIAVYPVVRISPIIIQICYPIMAKMKDSLEGLKNAYLQIIDFITYVNIPLLGGLFVMAANVIPLIYGAGWEPTVPLIKIFVFMGIFSCMLYPLSPLAFSTGKPNLLFYLNLATFAIKLPLIYILAKYYSTTGVASGFLIGTFLSLVLGFLLVQRLVGSYFQKFLANVIKPVGFTVLMVGVILLYKYFIGDHGVIHTIAQVAIGGVIFGALTLKYKISLNTALQALGFRKEATVLEDSPAV